jgi:hypothetical protein
MLYYANFSPQNDQPAQSMQLAPRHMWKIPK